MVPAPVFVFLKNEPPLALMKPLRFGRDNFQEAMKVSNRASEASIDWTNFSYMIFDLPTHKGNYSERYIALG